MWVCVCIYSIFMIYLELYCVNCNFNPTQTKFPVSSIYSNTASYYHIHPITRLLRRLSRRPSVYPGSSWITPRHRWHLPRLICHSERNKKSTAHKKAQCSFGKPKHSQVVYLISQHSNGWFCAQHQWFDRFCSPLESPQRAKSVWSIYAGHSYAAAA